MPHEKLLPATVPIGAVPDTVPAGRKGNEFKILVCLNQRIDDLQGAGGVDVFVEQPDGEQQLARFPLRISIYLSRHLFGEIVLLDDGIEQMENK